MLDPDPDPQLFSDLSEASLEDMMLSAENEAANVRKGFLRELDRFTSARVIAALCRYMIRHRKDFNIRPKKDVTSTNGGLLPKVKPE